MCETEWRRTLVNYIRSSNVSEIEIRYENELIELVAEKNHITGVKVLNKADNTTSTINADLTVDCGGMLTSVPKMLEKLGFPLRKTTVKSYLQYASMLFQFPPDEKLPFNACYYQQMAPDKWQGCVLWYQSNSEFICTCMGINRNIPDHKIPTQKEGLVCGGMLSCRIHGISRTISPYP